MQYWYSAQLRQYRLQFIRAFSNFSIKTGKRGPNNTEELIRVPCRYGDPTRLAAAIVAGNSENKAPAVPFISCLINSINMNPSRRHDPQLVQSVQINERKYDEELGRYTNEIGNRYTVERYMPVPYDLTFQVDIWTNNLDVKEQLLEQILVLYNPAIDVQTSVNPIDWTVLSYIEMMDNLTWTSRSIPIGTENPIDVTTMMFKVPIWINPPAKVKKQAIIQQIVTNIVQGDRDENAMEWNSYELLSRTITTPGDATVRVSPNSDGTYDVRLCDDAGSTSDSEALPTVTFAAQNPQPFPGLSFTWNDRVCTVTSSNIDQAVADIRSSLGGSDLNCVVFNETSMQLINTSGGDNIFSDVVPGSLAALGLEEGVYPGGSLAWWRLLQLYGTVKSYSSFGSNASQIRFKTIEDIDQTNTDIVGWIEIDQFDQNKIIWTPDPQSFPTVTLSPIDAIINPQTSGPNINLPRSSVGQRYLLTEDASESSVAWGTMSAKADDIIEFDGNLWQTVWKAMDNADSTQYLLNNRSSRVYRWYNSYWAPVVDAQYRQGYWRLVL